MEKKKSGKIENIKKSGVYFSVSSITGIKPESVKKNFNRRKLDALDGNHIKAYVSEYFNK
jgi:hypothetical protein